MRFLVSTGSDGPIREIVHQADGKVAASELRVPRTGNHAEPRELNERARSTAKPLAGATSAAQARDGGRTVEIKIPWESLAPGEDFDLSMLEMRLLVAATRATSESAPTRATYTSAELPKQPIEDSLRWWPRYRLAEGR